MSKRSSPDVPSDLAAVSQDEESSQEDGISQEDGMCQICQIQCHLLSQTEWYTESDDTGYVL